MTDTRTFLQQLIVGVNNFTLAFEQIKLLADRIQADSALSAATAAAAQLNGRSDLSTGDFDNFNSAAQLLETTLTNSSTSVNTGGSVRLAFYKII